MKNIDRRGFIKLTGSASVAVLMSDLLLSSSFTLASKDDSDSYLQFLESEMPVLSKSDVIIYGGSFAGIAAALAFTEKGAKVTIVEPRTYLGSEHTASLRTWFALENGLNKADLPELLLSCIEEKSYQAMKSLIQLRPDKVKLVLEDALLNRNIDFVYASVGTQLINYKGEIKGLVMGNKSGRQAILGNLIIDASESATLLRLNNEEFNPTAPLWAQKTTTILEFTQVEPLLKKTISVPEKIGITWNKIQVCHGYRGKDHVLIECTMDLPVSNNNIFEIAKRDDEARFKSIEVAAWLIQNVPEFKNAFLGGVSFEPITSYTNQLKPPGKIADDEKLSLSCRFNKMADFNLSDFQTSTKNFWCLSEAARLNDVQNSFLRNIIGAYALGTALSSSLFKRITTIVKTSLPPTKTITIPDTDNFETVDSLATQKSPQAGKSFEMIDVDLVKIPVLDSADILVVGGGTSGATAAIAAAKEKKKTIMVDMNPVLGGTGTIGGVYDYWGHGRYKGFTGHNVERLKEVHKLIPNHVHDHDEYYRDNPIFITWNIEAKTFIWHKDSYDAGVMNIRNAVSIGAIVNDNQVDGAVVATRHGMFGITSKVLIDATGDGDIAAFAGAEFKYGSGKDTFSMWYSVPRFKLPGITWTSFLSSCDPSNIIDYNRSILVARRLGSDMHDHRPYLCPRESRHIQGDDYITLTDTLRMRQWPGVINVHYSNCDIKGYHTSDWMRIGLIPPNLNVEIPLGSIIPKKLEKIIISGKAVSCNHEPCATIRMQPDMENLGGIAALAASQAIDENVTPRKIDIKKLQKRLIALDLLPVDVLERKITEKHYSSEELESLVDQFKPDMPLWDYSNMQMGVIWSELIPFVEVCSEKPAVAIPVLNKKLKEATGTKALRIAQALAFLGSDAGAKVIYDEILIGLKGNVLPVRNVEIMHSDGVTPPDQAAMPQTAYLIYALGMTKSPLNIPVWNKIADLLNPKEDDFYSQEIGIFYYIDAVCNSANILGSVEAVKALTQMHKVKYINSQSLKSGIEENFIFERRSMMELLLGRALARSGSTDGYAILIEYLDDMRAVLSEFANKTLDIITGKKFGKNKTLWNEWLIANNSSIKPCPVDRGEG